MFNPDIFVSFGGYNPNGIATIFLQMLHHRFGHINKGYLVAGLAQKGSDESTADITAAIHNCLFHVLFLHCSMYIPRRTLYI